MDDQTQPTAVTDDQTQTAPEAPVEGAQTETPAVSGDVTPEATEAPTDVTPETPAEEAQ